MPKRQDLLDPPRSTSGMIAEIPEALGQSDYFLEFRERLSRVAPINRPVLIVGERGTGKELAASRLHFLSKRWQGPLVTLNCSALTPSLIESELFGFEKGAFTGALERRKGRFESADGGTLFLDEIGKIPSEVQEKILRAVEYGSFERVGSSGSIKVDVRIIAATNADLPALAEEGKFKKDLLDRLSFEVLTLPPLRKRGEDILILANHFAAQMAQELGWEELPSFSEDATQSLQSYPWPGNVRELKNVVERAIYRSDSPLISHIAFDPFQSSSAEKEAHKEVILSSGGTGELLGDPSSKPFKKAVRIFEIQLIREALIGAKYNQKKVARRLGLSYDQFRGVYRKYKKELQEA
jgi:psp operon transcriptional activator